MEASELSDQTSNGALTKLTGVLKDSVVIQVQVAGETVLAFMDTGAFFTTVDSKLVERHPEQFIQDNMATYSNVDGSGSVVVYKVKHFKIGSLVLDNQLVFAQDLSRDKVQVRLGLKEISRANWILDLKNSRWQVTPL